MHESWTIQIANTMYTRLQNYTIVVALVGGEHGIQLFEVVVVVVVVLLL